MTIYDHIANRNRRVEIKSKQHMPLPLFTSFKMAAMARAAASASFFYTIWQNAKARGLELYFLLIPLFFSLYFFEN